MKLGRILADLKAELKTAKPTRFWEPYVRDHLGIHPRTASNYMRIWREASDLDKLGKNLESETISDTGIREVLDLLADARKKLIDVGPSENSKSPRENESTSPGKLQDPPIDLADGSRLDMKGIRWKDGLITREALESWMGRIVMDPEGSREQKLRARRQRAVIHIAAGINRACGTADPPSAAELVESSFEDILAMLQEKSSEN